MLEGALSSSSDFASICRFYERWYRCGEWWNTFDYSMLIKPGRKHGKVFPWKSVNCLFWESSSVYIQHAGGYFYCSDSTSMILFCFRWLITGVGWFRFYQPLQRYTTCVTRLPRKVQFSSFQLQLSDAKVMSIDLDSTTVFADILKTEVVECLKKYASVGNVNIRFSNIAQAFLAAHVHSSWSCCVWSFAKGES